MPIPFFFTIVKQQNQKEESSISYSLIKDHSKSKLKTLLKDLIEGEPYFGLSINEIVRHVPLSERNYGNRFW